MCVSLIQKGIQAKQIAQKNNQRMHQWAFFLMMKKVMILVGVPHLFLAKSGRNGLKV